MTTSRSSSLWFSRAAVVVSLGLFAATLMLSRCAFRVLAEVATAPASSDANKGNGAVTHATTLAWPLFRGNPLQTGVAEPLPEKLDILWTFTAKDGFESAVAIANGVVYAGSLDEHLYALDLKTGQEKWRYKAGPFKAPPSLRGKYVYAGDCDGLFHCIDAASGRKQWSFETGSEISSGANFVGDSILFGSGDENLYCLTGDGKLRWKFKVAGGPVLASPAVVGERTFVAGCDSSLHVLDTAKGTEILSVNLDGQTGGTAAVDGDRLFIGTMSNQVLALDWKKGEVLWRFEASKRQQPFYSSAALSSALVIIGSRDKRVHALDRKTGNEVWSFTAAEKVDGSPVIAGKRIYVGCMEDQGPNFFALDLDTGKQITSYKLDGAVSGSAAIAEKRLVIGTQKGKLYCLGPKNP